MGAVAGRRGGGAAGRYSRALATGKFAFVPPSYSSVSVRLSCSASPLPSHLFYKKKAPPLFPTESPLDVLAVPVLVSAPAATGAHTCTHVHTGMPI